MQQNHRTKYTENNRYKQVDTNRSTRQLNHPICSKKRLVYLQYGQIDNL